MTGTHIKKLEAEIEAVKAKRTQLIWGVRNTRSADRQQLVSEAMVLLQTEKQLSERLVVAKAVHRAWKKTLGCLPFVPSDDAVL